MGRAESGETADRAAIDQNEIDAYEALFMQGAVQGISFMFSSGDNGDELDNTGIRQADYPTSDPYVTSVGGTSTAIDGNGVLAGETGWGTHKYSLVGNVWEPVGFLYGAGGGRRRSSTSRPTKPASCPGSYRQVPDVGMDADPTTGMLIGETQTFPNGVHYGEYRIGGTSLASPLFAGMTALSLQRAPEGWSAQPDRLRQPCHGVQRRQRPGFRRGQRPGRLRERQRRVGGLLYSVRTFNQDSSLKVTTGWDNVTGVGSPTARYFDAFPGGR